MGIRLAALVALAACPALSGRAQEKRDAPVADFTLADAGGTKHALQDLKGAKAVVLVFLGTECPMANQYVHRLLDLHKAYSGRGVAFLAVNPNGLESAEDVAKHAKEAGLPFPVLLDPEQKVADALKVSIIPTAIVLDSSLCLRYRGRIDDHKSEDRVRSRYLSDAIAALLDARPIATAETEPVGCQIQRRVEEARDAGVTYASHVAKILNERCVACHRPGQTAPFSLATYEQARRWSANIARVSQARTMPPWKPVNEGMFRGERRLTKDEIDVLTRWAAAGAPMGDPAKVPPATQFPVGWPLGQPDLILEPDQDYELEPSDSDEYRCFVLDPKLTEDRYVAAVDFRAGNARVVHHAVMYVDHKRLSLVLDEQDPKLGFSSKGTGPTMFDPLGDLGGGWIPGMSPTVLPDGTGYLVPRGSRIVMEIHYHKNGRREKDRSTVGLYFAKKAVLKSVQKLYISNQQFEIPAGAKRVRVTAGISDVPADLHMLYIIPHMHLIGREIKVRVFLPDRTEQVLVHITDWDFYRHEAYYFKEPVALPKGSRLLVEGWYDNSADNPNNPHNPPKIVRTGSETTDEMLGAYIAWTSDQD